MSFDFVVVGAGVIGCAVARELAERGAAVAIVDDRPIAMGATQASAGVLAPYIEAREGTPLLALAVRSLGLYDAFVERVAAETGASIPYRRSGTIDLAISDDEQRNLETTASVLTRMGVASQLVDGPAARSAEPLSNPGVIGALVVEAHGFVGAAELTRALAQAARQGGARLLEPQRVTQISRRDGDAIVQTSKGLLACGTVVLAAGSWSGRIAIDGVAVPPPVRPVRGQLLSLQWHGERLRRVTWSSRCYMVPWEEGTVLLGATVEEVGFDERATVDGVQGLLDAAREVIPAAQRAGFNRARVGLRPATSDGLPIVGRSRVLPSLVYATGHYRNGVLLAPLTAALVADLALDHRTDPMLAAMAPERFGGL